MDLIYLAFANDSSGGLEALNREREAIVKALLPKRDSGELIIHVEENATSAKIARDLFKYRRRLIAFHYSGHADPGFLHFGEELARADGMATLLGKCPNLKLVILNGCSTREQVKLLYAKGVKVVISTSAPVKDSEAAEFGVKLWNALAAGESIENAFDSELGEVELSEVLNDKIHQFRGTVDEDEDYDEEKEEFWGLYGKSRDRSWKLPESERKKASEYVPNRHLADELCKALSSFDTKLGEIQKKEDDGNGTKFEVKLKQILPLFPVIISENLRKLAAKPDPYSKAIFYNEPGVERLKIMSSFYQTLMDMLCFIMLARLWDEKIKIPNLIILKEEGELLESFIYAAEWNRVEYNYIQLINGIFKIFERENVRLTLLKELEGLKVNLHSESPFVHACIFFKRCSELKLSKENSVYVEEISKDAEIHLTNVLKQLCFTVLYDFVSVRSIKVFQNRLQLKAKYQYSGSKLYGARNSTDLEVLDNFIDNITDTSSILLTRKEGISDFINLTPFIIDANVFKDRVCNLIFQRAPVFC